MQSQREGGNGVGMGDGAGVWVEMGRVERRCEEARG
jgi:hypothetical protein